MAPSDISPRLSTQSSPPGAEAIARIKAIVGDKGWSNDPAILEMHINDEHGLYLGKCALFVPGPRRPMKSLLS